MDPEILVVGGGPAGSTAAALLAREGRRVTLVDRARFPRYHIGESLLPAVLLFLDELGVRAEVEAAGFHKKQGQTFLWGRDPAPWHLDFRTLDAYPYSWFVDRARFDTILLRNAARLGATVHEETRVIEFLRDGERVIGAIVDDGTGPREIRARHVIDASGQSALLAQGGKLREWVEGLKSLAIWAYYDGVGTPAPPEDEHIITVAVDDGWVWWIPMAKGRASVGLVTNDPGGAQQRGREELTAWFDRLVRGTTLVKDWLVGATRDGDAHVQRDWSYRASRFHGPGWLLAGDAACFIDPILSSGVNLAMSGGYLAALALCSTLAEPAHEATWLAYFERAYRAIYDEQLESIKHFYTVGAQRDSVYWKSKQLLAVDPGLEKDLAFVFISSGLARHVTGAAPHDVAGQARAVFTSRRGGEDGEAAATAAYKPRDAGERRLVPAGELVVEGDDRRLYGLVQRGFRLALEPYTGAARPEGALVLLEIESRTREPLGVVRLEPVRPDTPRHVRRAAGFAVSTRAYRRDAATDRILGAAADAILAALLPLPLLDLPAAARAVRAALAAGGDGWSLTPALPGDRRDLAEQPVSAEYLRDGAQLFVIARPRRPVEIVEAPFLRTRFVDLEYRGAEHGDARELLDRAARAVRAAVDGKPDLHAALGACEQAFATAAAPPWRLVAIRRVQT